MLGQLLGSINKECVPIYLSGRGRRYAREIARFFNTPLSPIQRATEKLEQAEVLVSRSVGSTREYEFNPGYFARVELAALLAKALSGYPPKLRDEQTITRTRTLRKGKPL